MPKIKDSNLYFLVTGEHCAGRGVLEVMKKAISGGVNMVQLREKNILRSGIVDVARLLAGICKKENIPFIINDDPILAKEVDADGVHLGQGDMKLFTIEEARRLLGPKKIIGISTSSIEEVIAANMEDADYIGFGPVFPTKIKDKCVGTKEVKRVLTISAKPVFFIGGIDPSNLDELLVKGASNIAVVRAISEANDIENAARTLKTKLNGRKNGKTS